MYINAGYLNNSRLDFKDYSAPLIVGSCGTYRLKRAKGCRPIGRKAGVTTRFCTLPTAKHIFGLTVWNRW